MKRGRLAFSTFRPAPLQAMSEKISEIHRRRIGLKLITEIAQSLKPFINADGVKKGRPSYDAVTMFKILVIQAQNNLSDERTSDQ